MRYQAIFRWAAIAVIMVPATAGCDPHEPTRMTVSGGTSSKLDTDGSHACAVFAAGWRRATTNSSRLKLADTVTRLAGRSNTATVTNHAAAVGRAADNGTPAWTSSGTALLNACHQSGWRPKPSQK